MADISTNSILKFARGTRENWISAATSGLFKDFIYFATDTNEIFMWKDSSTFGSYGVRTDIADFSVDSSSYMLKLKLTYNDGSEQVVHSVSLKEVIQKVVRQEEFPEFEARLSAVENAVTWQEVQ